MTDESLDISFVIPCLNEAKTVVATLETLREAISALPFSYEILVIDDGSTDMTSEAVQDYALRHPEIPLRLHRNPRNLGLATSYVNGAFMCRGKYYKLLSGDNAEPKESLVRVFSHLGRADMLISYLSSVSGKSAFRMGLSNFYTFLVNAITGYKIRYYNGGAVHLRYNVMRWGPYSFGFGFQAELITRLLDEGATYCEVPIEATHTNKNDRNNALNWRNFLSVAHTMLELSIRRVRRKAIGR